MDHGEKELSNLGSAPLELNISAQSSAKVTAPVLNNVNVAGSINLNIQPDNRGAQQGTSLGSTGTGDPHQDENKRFTESIRRAQHTLKSRLSEELKCINEGSPALGLQRQFHEVYTELYITEGGSEGVNNEHEVRMIETASKSLETQETAVCCNDIFKPLPGQEKRIRTVLTKGIAGIGKTVSVQKFILDWAEGTANQDIDFIFTLPFRDLNLQKDNEFSLIGLLQDYFPELTFLNDFSQEKIQSFDRKVKVLFVFDGLDEYRPHLIFKTTKILRKVNTPISVHKLLTNLIQGNLLPSALLWITSRPAAANQIPLKHVHRVTEVRGFTDSQKEEYFRKRFDDQEKASRIISHIKSSRSLDIMCHIPVFCWISATVLETALAGAQSGDLPKSLTEMYTHFLLVQTNRKNDKFETNDTNPNIPSAADTEIIRKLGRLAFRQLKKGNLIFYKRDLRESGIDVREAAVYSGVCTQIFKKECGLHKREIYCFVHLSIQEYLAALFVFHSCVNENRNELSVLNLIGVQLSKLYKTAVDWALESENGHWDLFVRFLLGLSQGRNQTLLEELLTKIRCRFLPSLWRESRSRSTDKTIQYIKEKIRWEPSAERTINLFHCLNELNDNSLVEEIHEGKLFTKELEPSQCSALAFVLLMSEEVLDEFDLRTYWTSAEGRGRLLPVIKNCRKARLNYCNLTMRSIEIVASALQSTNSPLRDLNLSWNNLGDSGVELLCAGLMSSNCKLQTLGLNDCKLTVRSCEIVASALQSTNSPLRDLDLSYNKLGDSGVELLCAGLMSPKCKLQALRLKDCNLTKRSCKIVASALQTTNSPLINLDLSLNDLGDSGVKLLCPGLSPNCNLQTLRLKYCNLTMRSCEIVASALQSTNSPLRDLDLSDNKLGDSGVELLCAGLMSPNCKLQTLRLGECDLTYRCCDVLASVLHSPHSELIDLELMCNVLYDSGVRALSAGLEDPHCKLQKLGLNSCGVSQRGCDSLALVLSSNPSHLRELDLRGNKLRDSGVRTLSAAKPDTLTLLWEELTLDPNAAH